SAKRVSSPVSNAMVSASTSPMPLTVRKDLYSDLSLPLARMVSGLTYAQMIPVWRSSGYAVKLIFLSLPDVEIAIERVATRVIQGGHNVPEEVIRRRFSHGIANFERYKLMVDSWQLYDNYGAPPVLLDES
ncbi:MAG: hypothetical protein WB870_01095, partial [Gallionellaceae bacterium]